MKNRKINFWMLILTIFVPFIFCTINAYAANPSASSLSGISGGGITKSSDGCKTWMKDGTKCTVEVKVTNKGTVCSKKSATGKATFTAAGSKTISGTLGTSTQGTSSVNCHWQVTIETHNRDNLAPKFDSNTVSLTGTCNKSSIAGSFTGNIGSNNRATCVGSVTATNHSLSDEQSGVASKTVSTTVTPGNNGTLVGKDKVGNVQYSDTKRKPLHFRIDKDTTPCTSTSISITSGTHYHGYYVGTVTCTAKCLADNLKTGANQTGTTTGTVCTAYASDYAGNTTKKTIPVKRDTTKPTCSVSSTTSEGTSNGYRLGKVTVTWKKSDGQTGFGSSGAYNTTETKTTNDNTVTSLGTSATDNAGNTASCPSSSWKRDTTAPNGCNYSFDTKQTQLPSTDKKIASVENTQYSNSSVHATAWCTSDGQSGCSSTRHTRDYNSNGTHSGNSGIGVYDLTEHYSANPKNVLMCPITVTLIDQAAPTCSATITVANPVLSSDKTKWTTNTWHNNQDKVYDVNGNVEKTNSAKRVQAYLNTSSDNATSGGNQSGIKSGFKGGTAMNNLADEARTTYNDGSENGIYTVFVRDRIFNTVNNSSRSGWSGSTLYAHGVNTTGNVGSCSAKVYSFDNTKPVAHIRLTDKNVQGNYTVWDGNKKIVMSANTVNNNINSEKNWSSVNVSFTIWGTDPNGGNGFSGNTYNGRSGVRKVCYRLTNPNKATSAWSCYEPNDQQDGSYSNRSAERSVPTDYAGITTIEVKVQDWAGNWSDVNNSQKVYIDTTRPSALADDDKNVSKNGFTETTGGQNYNSMKNPIYPTQTGMDRPWVSQFVNSVFKGSDSYKNQYAGAYQFGYYWSTIEYNVQIADNQPYLVRADNSSRVDLNWNYFASKNNANDKTAGVTAGKTSFELPGVSNPGKTDYYWLYVRACDNVKIGARNCQIYKSKLVRYDNEQPSIDAIRDVSNNETVGDDASNGHGWTNKLKIKISTSDKPVDNERSQVAYISYKWNTNYDTKDDDKNAASFDSTNNSYPNSSTSLSSLSESGWTYVKCSNEDSDANLCTTTIDFNKFVKNTSPVHEGYRFLKLAIVDKAGNVSNDNGVIVGPYKFDITPPEITGLEFRGHRADNNAEITYSK